MMHFIFHETSEALGICLGLLKCELQNWLGMLSWGTWYARNFTAQMQMPTKKIQGRCGLKWRPCKQPFGKGIAGIFYFENVAHLVFTTSRGCIKQISTRPKKKFKKNSQDQSL